jgi:hypothetical protein
MTYQRRGVFFSSLQGRIHPQQYRTHPFPSPANDQLLRSGRILLAKKQTKKHSIVRLSIAIWWCWKSPCGNCTAKSKHRILPYEKFNSFVFFYR